MDPSHLLVLIESLGTSFDCYVLGAFVSSTGLAMLKNGIGSVEIVDTSL